MVADVALKRGGTDMRFAFKESLNASWAPEKYGVDMTGALGPASVTAERKGEVMAFAVKTPAAAPTLEIPVVSNLVLMDNMIAAPYQVLLNMMGGKPGAVTVVVPFQMSKVPGALEGGGSATGTLDGKPVTVTKLLFKVASVTTEVYAEAGTNRLLRVFVPEQDAELVREGFVPAAAPAAPTIKMPAGVTESDVTFKTIDGAPYTAVLCLPSAGAPAALVVMMQGSGPQDRDETIGPNKPFRDIAWGLAERGVATLRFDKRTYAFPKSYKGSLESESIDDAVDALGFVRKLQGVDASKLFVLGHSLGGLAAVYVAQKAPVRGMILMSAPGRPMDQVIRDQVRTLNAAVGEPKLAEILKMQDDIMAKVRAGTATAKDLSGQPPDADPRHDRSRPDCRAQEVRGADARAQGRQGRAGLPGRLRRAAGGCRVAARFGSEALPGPDPHLHADEWPAEVPRDSFSRGGSPAAVLETIAELGEEDREVGPQAATRAARVGIRQAAPQRPPRGRKPQAGLVIRVMSDTGPPARRWAMDHHPLDFGRAPFLVIWEVTRACALACVHCRAEAIARRDPAELTTGEGMRLIDQVRAFGTPAPLFVLTGGDPMWRKDLAPLVRYADPNRA